MLSPDTSTTLAEGKLHLVKWPVTSHVQPECPDGYRVGALGRMFRLMSSTAIVSSRRATSRLGHALAMVVILGSCAAVGCNQDSETYRGTARDRAPLELFTAGALAQPLRVAADSFAAATGGPAALLESAGSLETVRKLTELQRIPDVVAVADAELISELLMPRLATWYVVVASDRMVLAYTERSRGASIINISNWSDIVTGFDVEVGRSDPDLDPAGYRALLAMKLAERQLASPGLAKRLLEHAPVTLMRPKSADLVALLQAGEVDYTWSYASTARAAGLMMLELPAAVNLGDATLASTYAAESVAVAGRKRGEALVIHGRPILFAMAVPTGAPHADRAADFVAWLLGTDGQRVLGTAGLELLPRPLVVGDDVPEVVMRALTPVAAGPGGTT